jgi:hypothetical protein
MADPKNGEDFAQALTDDVVTDPDAPENSDAVPPQTTGNEDSSAWPEEKVTGAE